MVENLKTKHTFYYFCLLFRSRDIFCRGRFYSRLGFSFSARLLLLYERGADCRVSCPLMGRPEVNCQSCSSSGCNLLTLVAELWGAICFKIVLTSFHSKGIENQISFIIAAKTVFIFVVCFHQPLATNSAKLQEYLLMLGKTEVGHQNKIS